MTEIIFEVTEDEVDGGYSASALGHGIHTQGDSVEEIRKNVKEAVDCYFDDTMKRPTAVVRFLDHATGNMSAVAATSRRQIERIRDYQTRLIADAVTGKLDVRDAAT